MSDELIARLREKCPYCDPCSADKLAAADLIEVAWSEARAAQSCEVENDVENAKLRAALERAERVVEAMRDIRETCAVNAKEELWSSGAASVLYMLGVIWAKAEDALRGDTTRADTVRDETLTSAQARGGANEWETFIAADGQPAIRRKRANSADQHKAGQDRG